MMRRNSQGLPGTTVQRARKAAADAGHEGWLLTLDAPNYQAVMTHAAHESLRREFYEAWTTRASDQGPHAGRWDNTPLMAEILALRHEAANLVGYANYAQYSLATKMARETGEVLDFLRELARVSRPAAEREFAELESFAGKTLEAWDVAFHSERLKRERLDVSEEELRPYFPLPRVLAGLFTVVTKLYGVRMVARADADVYHPDVRYYDVARTATARRAAGSSSTCTPARRSAAARGWTTAWAASGWAARPRCRWPTWSAISRRPVGERPSLLTHNDVLTLFHEFGHGLHHMLTRVDYPGVSGINGVPWDAVELPSQFMENFAWRKEVLPLISAHVETGEALPAATLAKLQATRTFQAGMQTVRQLEFALFDFRLHAEYSPASPPRIAETLAEVRSEVSVVRPPPFNRFPHSFQHIFSGGYAAGYYSYKWAEVLSADAFGAFEERGVFDRATARRFLHSILERGGSRDAMEAFVEFRGRKPDIEPLLRQMGLAA